MKESMLYAWKGRKMDKAALGQKLRQSRTALGWTQDMLAEKVDIGSMYLGEIERGEKAPSLNVFIKLIEAMHVSADNMLSYDFPPVDEFSFDEITQKLEPLEPMQCKTAADLLDAYIRNLDAQKN